MRRYLLINRSGDDPAAEALFAELVTRARANGLVVSELNRRTVLAVAGPAAPAVLRVGAWLLVGDVFHRRSPVLPSTAEADPIGYERKLMARFWGRYVGMLFHSDARLSCLLRDPSGALDCVTWSQDGLTLVCSEVEDWLIRRLRPPWRVDAGRIADALHDPLGRCDLMVAGPLALAAGTVQPLVPPGPAEPRLAEPAWRPADFARRGLAAAPPTRAAAARLRDAVDEAVTALGGLPGPLAVEVSGGLDSSIVAASLSRSSADTVRLWINAFGPTPESDERAYVTALERRLGFAAVYAPHETGPMNDAWLAALSGGFRPGLNALDHPHAEAWARLIQETGSTALMTGRGGDGVLVQAARSDVFTDHWRSRGLGALGAAHTRELAAANEVSIWTLLAGAVRQGRSTRAPLRRTHPILAPLASPPPTHPWLEGVDDLGPAKVFQIAGIIDSLTHHGPSALTARIDTRHPLSAQPVVEACLALPTPVLTAGGRDRGLARLAFADRLPPEILHRRSKGEMTRIYGRMVCDNLHILRPWLLEGRLASMGLIDRAAAETELTEDALIWRGQYATVMVIAAFESWTRAWDARLAPGH